MNGTSLTRSHVLPAKMSHYPPCSVALPFQDMYPLGGGRTEIIVSFRFERGLLESATEVGELQKVYH